MILYDDDSRDRCIVSSPPFLSDSFLPQPAAQAANIENGEPHFAINIRAELTDRHWTQPSRRNIRSSVPTEIRLPCYLHLETSHFRYHPLHEQYH